MQYAAESIVLGLTRDTQPGKGILKLGRKVETKCMPGELAEDILSLMSNETYSTTLGPHVGCGWI